MSLTLIKTVYAEHDNPMSKPHIITAAVLASAAFSAQAEIEIGGSASVEGRYFLQDALYPGQPRSQTSVAIEPEFYTQWNDGQDSLLVKPFARLDQRDSKRTHVDMREFQWLHVADEWETRVGVGKVFWGQTESLHLVDIINQTDTVEQFDGEEKLGQPMVNFTTYGDWGTVSAFVLPYFRERTFNGMDGRLRPGLPIENDRAVYESGAEQQHIDYALRYQNSLGQWEVGLSYFDGTTREPELQASIEDQQNAHIFPYYAQIQQVGVDLLKVQGAWLLKFEGIYRTGQSEDFGAAVAGFERTTVGVFGTNYDLGLLMEYQYDERENNFFAIGQNDLMVGARWTFNDIDGTELLAGYIQDLDNSGTYSGFVEASSRMTDNWRWKLDAYFFSSDVPGTFNHIRRDDHLQVTLEYFF